MAALTLVASAVMLVRLASALAWSRATTWAGFVALFGSFAYARHALYYSTLTDPTAALLGLATVWAYVERRPIVLALCAAIAAGTWVSLFPIAAAALILPRTRTALPELTGRWLLPVA